MSSTCNFEVYTKPTAYWLAVTLGNYCLAIWGNRIKNMKTIFTTTATARIIGDSYTKKVAEKIRNGYVAAGAFSLGDLGPLVLEVVETAVKDTEKLGVNNSALKDGDSLADWLNPEAVRAAIVFSKDNSK
jgi:hypothetical protein